MALFLHLNSCNSFVFLDIMINPFRSLIFGPSNEDSIILGNLTFDQRRSVTIKISHLFSHLLINGNLGPWVVDTHFNILDQLTNAGVGWVYLDHFHMTDMREDLRQSAAISGRAHLYEAIEKIEDFQLQGNWRQKMYYITDRDVFAEVLVRIKEVLKAEGVSAFGTESDAIEDPMVVFIPNSLWVRHSDIARDFLEKARTAKVSCVNSVWDWRDVPQTAKSALLSSCWSKIFFMSSNDNCAINPNIPNTLNAARIATLPRDEFFFQRGFGVMGPCLVN